MKRDVTPEEVKYSIDQEPAGFTRLFHERDLVVQSKSAGFGTILGRTEVSQIHVPIYSGGLASDLSRVRVSIEIGECYSCGSHDSLYCDYCGRCSHCCENMECQYGCDFV